MGSSAHTDDDLDMKLGQMLMVGFRGFELREDHPIVRDIREHHLGGVILFEHDTTTAQRPLRNIHDPDQVRQLTASLQHYASSPLFIAIDQEGGHVNRLKECRGFPATVSARHLGRMNRLELTRNHAGHIAATLVELGINLNLAPVVDLDRNPSNPIIGKFERSFSADPNIVATHALEWIRAHHTYGILCALKHFPGHGSARHDSHLGCVDVTDVWSSDELFPYSQIIPTGECDMVMMAHIFHAGLDAALPATLSRKIVTGMLREQLRYDGLILSDDMQMKAITSYYTLQQTLQFVLEAGVDLLVFGNNCLYDEMITVKSVTLMKQLVLDGVISRERIDRSYQRIVRVKSRLSVL